MSRNFATFTYYRHIDLGPKSKIFSAICYVLKFRDIETKRPQSQSYQAFPMSRNCLDPVSKHPVCLEIYCMSIQFAQSVSLTYTICATANSYGQMSLYDGFGDNCLFFRQRIHALSQNFETGLLCSEHRLLTLASPSQGSFLSFCARAFLVTTGELKCTRSSTTCP